MSPEPLTVLLSATSPSASSSITTLSGRVLWMLSSSFQTLTPSTSILGAGAPFLGAGAELRVGHDDYVQWVTRGKGGFFSYSGSTKPFTSITAAATITSQKRILIWISRRLS